MFWLTDLILLSWTKAMDISAWSMMNSTAFAPALCYTLDVRITTGLISRKQRTKESSCSELLLICFIPRHFCPLSFFTNTFNHVHKSEYLCIQIYSGIYVISHLCLGECYEPWRTYRGCHTVGHNIFLDCCMPGKKKNIKKIVQNSKEEFWENKQNENMRSPAWP